MNKNYSIKLVERVFPKIALLLIFGFGIAPLHLQGVQSSTLSIEDNVGLVFLRLHEGSALNLYQYANPEAQNYLESYLEKDELSEYEANIWRILGYLGDTNLVEKIESRVIGYTSEALTDAQHVEVRSMFDCLGILSGRDIDKAENLLNRMLRYEFWAEKPIVWYPERGREANVYESLFWIANACAFNSKSNLDSICDGVVREMESEEIKNRYAWKFDSNAIGQYSQEAASSI